MDTTENLDYGEVKIVDDVVATIAGLAAIDVKGVAGMSGGFVGGIAEMLGKKKSLQGGKGRNKGKGCCDRSVHYR